MTIGGEGKRTPIVGPGIRRGISDKLNEL